MVSPVTASPITASPITAHPITAHPITAHPVLTAEVAADTPAITGYDSLLDSDQSATWKFGVRTDEAFFSGLAVRDYDLIQRHDIPEAGRYMSTPLDYHQMHSQLTLDRVLLPLDYEGKHVLFEDVNHEHIDFDIVGSTLNSTDSRQQYCRNLAGRTTNPWYQQSRRAERGRRLT